MCTAACVLAFIAHAANASERAAQYALNDACVECQVPLVSGAALGMHGQLAVYAPVLHPERGCLRCAFPAPLAPEDRGTCAEDGVLGPVPAIVGGLQALEALKLLCGAEAVGAICSVDVQTLDSFSWGVARQRRDERCPVCGPAKRLAPALDGEVALFKGREAAITVDLGGGRGVVASDVALETTLAEVRRDPAAVWRRVEVALPAHARDVVFVCRRGQTSLAAVSLMNKAVPRAMRAVEFRSFVYQ